MRIFYAVFFTISICKLLAVPVNYLEKAKPPPFKVLNFLKKFGYIEKDDGDSGALYSQAGIEDAIRNVQKFGALPETGILDEATLKLMSSPRCGVPDIIKTRSKRYAFGSEGWKKTNITYFIANWLPIFGKSVISQQIEKALKIWGRYSRLTFREISDPSADIIVAFGSSYHGDVYPFDGPGNILAHAFFPYEEEGFGGDVHFDADENWKSVKSDDGMDFFTVALHELGHSLGLSHSAVPDSVMFPYYKGEDDDNNKLGYDDILAMYELYISRQINDEVEAVTVDTVTVTDDDSSEEHDVTTLASNETISNENVTEIFDENNDVEHITELSEVPNICHGNFDAVAALREEIFVFKDEFVWKIENMSKVKSGYPIKINNMFPNLPNDIKKLDAVYERPDGFIVLFTGDQFWVYDGEEFTENSPQNISFYGLNNTIDRVDAVQTWSKNGKTYIYKYDRFWRYDENTKKVDKGYPRHIERWRGVPQNLDSATTWKGTTYFFKGMLYWKFDNDWIMVTEQSPLPAPQLFLGCPEENQLNFL